MSEGKFIWSLHIAWFSASPLTTASSTCFMLQLCWVQNHVYISVLHKLCSPPHTSEMSSLLTTCPSCLLNTFLHILQDQAKASMSSVKPSGRVRVTQAYTDFIWSITVSSCCNYLFSFHGPVLPSCSSRVSMVLAHWRFFKVNICWWITMIVVSKILLLPACSGEIFTQFSDLSSANFH